MCLVSNKGKTTLFGPNNLHNAHGKMKPRIFKTNKHGKLWDGDNVNGLGDRFKKETVEMPPPVNIPKWQYYQCSVQERDCGNALPPLPSPLAPFRQIELKGRKRVFIADIGRPSPLSVWASNISKKRSRHHPPQREHDIKKSHRCNLPELPPLPPFWGWQVLETWDQHLFDNHSDKKPFLILANCWNQRQCFWELVPIFIFKKSQNSKLKTEIHC